MVISLTVAVQAGGGGPPRKCGPPGGGGGGGAPSSPLLYKTAAQFIAMWDNTPTDVRQQMLEQIAIVRVARRRSNLPLWQSTIRVCRCCSPRWLVQWLLRLWRTSMQRTPRPWRRRQKMRIGPSCCALQVLEQEEGRGCGAVNPHE
jgi:hypothetical protein